MWGTFLPAIKKVRSEPYVSPPGRREMAKAKAHKWEFRARFRRHAFGWKSQPAIKRIKESVSEIEKVARKDKVLAAEGAVMFLVLNADSFTMKAAENATRADEVRKRIRDLVAKETFGECFVTKVLGRQLGLA